MESVQCFLGVPGMQITGFAFHFEVDDDMN
jgi:hypothetical protein